jgi:hypothetical protein
MPDQNGRFKGISIPSVPWHEEPTGERKWWWISPDGVRVEYEPILLGLDDDGHEVFSHRRDAISNRPPERPIA